MTSVEILPEVAEAGAVTVSLAGIGTATPGSLVQEEIVPLAEELGCASDKERSFLRRVFSRSGVERRGSVLIQEGREVSAQLRAFYPARASDMDQGPTTAERMAVYAREAPALAERAARAAAEDAGIEAREITHLITVTCTGFMAPGLDAELMRRLGLRADLRRTQIGFMGCHAAFNALGAARSIVAADARAMVLVVCVELSTLHFQYGFDPQKLVANALFADGSSAVVVREGRGEKGEWRLRETASFLLPETPEAMTWRIGDHGFAMTLSPELPAILQRNVREWCEGWLGRAGVVLEEVRSWAVHPGGPKVLTAVEEALGLASDDLRFSRAVLAEHGNMSSATVLFVLQRMAREAAMEGARAANSPCVALGFGPGLMLEGMLLERQ